MVEKQDELTKMIEDFCDVFLNDNYKRLSLKLIDEMAKKKNVYFQKGKLEVWASAIIYSISQVNSLFDKENELYIDRKDIFGYFNTTQAVVSRKAINLRDIFDMDKKFLLSNALDDLDTERDKKLYSDIMDFDFGDDKSMFEGDMSVEDYQRVIDNYKKEMGEEFFRENEGLFWLLHETRPFMQCLYEQAQMFWDMGEKDKAIDQYKYLLKLNPNDNQGVRDCLFPNLVELNRLKEAQELYMRYENDFTATWRFTKLLLDIKMDLPLDKIKKQYKSCSEYNPHVVPYLTGTKRLPSQMPMFYTPGDENEAVFYYLVAKSAWQSDKKAMRLLKKLSKS